MAKTVKSIKGKRERRKKFSSPTKRKILLLLQAGFALSLTPSPRMHGYILRELGKDWRSIDQDYLKRIVNEFRYEKLIDWQEKQDGSIKVVLSKRGEEYALEYKIDEIKIKKPAAWDQKWRLVMFDIPERKRKARDALRNKLKELGFHELQKSVFVCPFPCQNEVEFIVEFFEVRRYVRFGEIINLINEEELKLHFDLA